MRVILVHGIGRPRQDELVSLAGTAVVEDKQVAYVRQIHVDALLAVDLPHPGQERRILRARDHRSWPPDPGAAW